MDITEKSFISNEKLKLFNDVDGFEVIEQLLLFKGEDYYGEIKVIPFKALEDMALVHYGLQITPTNRLYVGTYLMKFYKKNDLIQANGKIKIPLSIYEKAQGINQKFRH